VRARRLLAGVLSGALLLGGCAHFPSANARSPGACAPGETRVEVAHLIFGRNIGATLGVSDADFARFLDEEVTPRFPDGLTVLDGEGQWRDGQTLVKEPSKLLIVTLAGRPGERAALEAIREAYKVRFRQQAVMILTEPGCVSF
jgi:hypothetical protein